jgi:hypothetical protein
MLLVPSRALQNVGLRRKDWLIGNEQAVEIVESCCVDLEEFSANNPTYKNAIKSILDEWYYFNKQQSVKDKEQEKKQRITALLK